MQSLYYLKTPLLILLTGLLVRFVATFFKIMHWRFGDELVIAGSIVLFVAIVCAIIKIAQLKKP